MCEKTGKIVHLANVPIEDGRGSFKVSLNELCVEGVFGGGLAGNSLEYVKSCLVARV